MRTLKSDQGQMATTRAAASTSDARGAAGEIARLRAALAERDAQLSATAEVLCIVAGSPGDVEPILSAILSTAMRLVDAPSANIQRVVGDDLAVEATHARDPRTGEVSTRTGLLRRDPIGRGSAPGRAVLDRCTIHLHDVAALAPEDGYASAWVDRVVNELGHRTFLATPLLHREAVLGVLVVRREVAQPFTDQQIALVETFASQAVIAIENARLFSELKQSLEQQTATADILRVIAGSPTDAGAVLEAIVDAASRLCAGAGTAIHLREGDELVTGASRGERARTVGDRARMTAENPTFVAVNERRTVNTADVTQSFPRSAQAQNGLRSFIAVPLSRHGEAIGVLTARRLEVQPFTAAQRSLMEAFADQAVIAIENARLFSELQQSNATLKEALDQQTATADILRTIAGSRTDLGEVLPAIARTVRRLCDADGVYVDQLLGGNVRKSTFAGADGETGVDVFDLPLRREQVVHRAMLERRTIHVPDLELAPVDEWPDSRRSSRPRGIRTILGVPMLRSGAAVGGIALQRRPEGTEARPFSDAQIRVAEAFADQAAIAIENALLLEQLEERDTRRRQELERAAEIQQRLLPETVEGWPGALEVAVRFRPAVETSGDFYDVLPLTPSVAGALPPLQIAVGDVAGKGMSAALVTALARSALRSTAFLPLTAATPANTLRLAGQRLNADVGNSHFVACALAVVEPAGLHHAGPRLRLANAAQVPVLLVRHGTARELEPPGYRLPLGAQADSDYEDVTTDLAPGDVVVFSSDGLVEAPSHPTAAAPAHLAPPEKAADLFGFARLAAYASHAGQATTAEAVAAGIWSDLTAWCGDESHHDDMTLLVLRVSG